MIEYQTILVVCLLPEICFVLGMFFPGTRRWWGRLIEDSDGDPHHTDGFFLISLYSALWCIRIGILAGLQEIFFGKRLIEVEITFLTAGATLLGVRLVFRPKIEPIKRDANEK